MALDAAMKNARDTARIVRSDVNEYIDRRRAEPVSLEPGELPLVHALRADGYVVVPDYWPRDRALAMRDRLEAYLEEGQSKDFPSGAYLRFRDNVAYDEGVRRLYHVDKEIPELAEHRNDPFIRRVVEAYYGRPYHSGVLMYQYNTKSNDNTRYHHVDAFSKEFKSFLYLDDVDEGNGPFAYIPGTQRSHLRRIVKQLRNGSAATGFSNEELKGVIDREVKLVGPAGTLILADVRGFHRGTPQLDRSRSVLVNYLYESPGDLQLER
jgi:Phytanoyl-CoA dioxygenase (PhyH)